MRLLQVPLMNRHIVVPTQVVREWEIKVEAWSDRVKLYMGLNDVLRRVVVPTYRRTYYQVIPVELLGGDKLGLEHYERLTTSFT